MLAPAVLAEPPPAWVEAALARPPLGDAADAAFTSFRSFRAPDGTEALAMGCVAAPIPANLGWVEDMRPSMEARGVALAGAAAERAAGTPVDARREGAESNRFVLRVAGGGPEPLGVARTALGFDAGKIVTCFAICTSTARRPPAACDSWIASVRFERGGPPPPPGLALRTITWAVHHAGQTAGAAGLAVTALGIVAVATRRKPRARI